MNTKRGLKIAGITVAALVILVAALVAWLSYGPINDAKVQAYKALPYPAAMVNGHPVLARDVMQRYEIAKKTLPQDSGMSDEEVRKQVYEKVVEEEKAEVVASTKGVQVSDQEVQDQYRDAVDQLTGGDEQKFTDMLGTYGLSKQDFMKQVLRPDLLVNYKLRTWYNGQSELNKDAYQKVADIQRQLGEGQSFETLAQQNSSDAQSNGMEGDLGFVEVNKLLPEFKSPLENARSGDLKTVASRYGLHVFKVEEVENQGEAQNNPRIHLRQIFIEPTGFENWFDSELGKLTVRQLIKI